MVGANVTKTVELFGAARSAISKIMTAFEKKEKPPHGSKTLEKNEGCLIGTVGLLRRLLGRITRMQHRKLLQSVMIIPRIQFPQKL